MKNSIKITLVLALLAIVSCQNDKKPNYQYMPNMYESVPLATYGECELCPDGKEGMLPAEGSVARGWLPYEIEDSNDGLAFAKANLKNPTAYSEERLVEGAALYNIYCGVCHGKKGDGKGILAQREKINGIPPYNDPDREITEGGIYHVMYYGINSMGSYASQLTEDEMWMIDHYVMSLKDKLDKKEARAFDVIEMVEEVEQLHEATENHGTEVVEEHGEDHGADETQGAEH